MQNRGTIKFFTILLLLATAYVLSFTFFANRFEKKASEIAMEQFEELPDAANFVGEAKTEKIESLTSKYLRDNADTEAYPVLGKTYREIKGSELNLGLDLQGGMAATLEVSLPDLLINLSDYTEDPVFNAAIAEAREMQNSSQDDYITLFETAWQKQNPTVRLSDIFNNFEYEDKFSKNVEDDVIFKELRIEAESAIRSTENIIRKRIDGLGVAQPNVSRDNSGRIIIELPGADDRERILGIIGSTANLEFWETFFPGEVGAAFQKADQALGRKIHPEAYLEDNTKKDSTTVVDDITDAVDNSLDSLGLDLGDIEEEDNVVDDAELERNKLKNPIISLLVSQGGQSSIGLFKASDVDLINEYVQNPEFKNNIPGDLRLLWGAKAVPLTNTETEETFEAYELYLIKDGSKNHKPLLDGSSITSAGAGFDEYGKPEVSMAMDAKGTGIWADMTTRASGDNNRSVAIVMDNKVYSAPSVRVPITGGQSSISMGALNNKQGLLEAEDLAGLLEAGSLPAPAKIVDDYSVGPSLGEANVKAGLMSFIIALMVILIYMVFYYKGAGVVADISLIINLLLLMGALASLGAALTLPGIAGIVLTIGMAVDANVLIFERIREEQRHGKSLMNAVKDGYNAAYSAIIDANVTTMLTGIILFVFGSGPIKGFATTLIIGIITSLFSAVIISKLIIYSRLDAKKPMSFSSNITKDWFTKVNIHFLDKRKKFYILSVVLVGLSLVGLFTRGVQYGVDFAGGSKREIVFDQPVDHTALINIMKDAFVTDDGTKASSNVSSIGSGSTTYKITTSYLVNSFEENTDQRINSAFRTGLDKVGVGYEVLSTSKVTGSISDDFRRGATWATIFSLLVIFLYIFFRFKKWTYGVGALIALTHDVIIVLGLFALLRGIVPFTLEINQAFIAAILTVIGYSINDTVVVFDRIREFLGLRRNQDQKEVINSALNSTLSRTVNTSLSTFIVLLMIFVFGGDDIKGFTFALMLGVIVGTYSSIFIATPAVVDLSKSAREEE